MNKFLKTKDNRIYIFKITERYSLHSSKMVDRYQELGTDRVCAYGHNLLKIENISKESNAIEEVCDEFVITNELVKGYVLTSIVAKSSIKWEELIENGFLKVQKVYGAVWTESGLKYICKLSNDGIFVPFTK